MTVEEIFTQIKSYIDQSRVQAQATSAPAEGYEEVTPPVLEDVAPEDYRAAMEMVFDEYEVPEEMRQGVYDQLDANADYSPGGYIENLTIVLEDNDVTNHIDNSIEVGDYAEVHGGIHQANETNVATASGDGAVAADSIEGDTQTGDGIQAGDGSDVQAVGGDNSGQVAGMNATAEDITTGDGNFNNEGEINDSSIAFGGGDSSAEANDTVDYSTNDTGNTSDSFNESDSYNTDGSYNTDESYTESTTVDAHLDVDTTESFNSDDDHHDVDDSHNVHEAADEVYD